MAVYVKRGIFVDGYLEVSKKLVPISDEKFLEVCERLKPYLLALEETATTSYDDSDDEIMIAKIEEITRVIEEHPEGDVSLLDEMGLGYIYDILPKDETIPLSEAAIEYLTNYAEDNNMLSTMNEAISILNEGIKDNVKKYIFFNIFKNLDF